MSAVKDTVPCRLPEALWTRVKKLAKLEHRSGQAQVIILIERGLKDLAGVEIARLSEARAKKLLEDVE